MRRTDSIWDRQGGVGMGEVDSRTETAGESGSGQRLLAVSVRDLVGLANGSDEVSADRLIG